MHRKWRSLLELVSGNVTQLEQEDDEHEYDNGYTKVAAWACVGKCYTTWTRRWST